MADPAALNLLAALPQGAGRPLRDCIRSVGRSLRQGDLAAAVRELDRAWRTRPDDAATLAPFYARLLAEVGTDPLAVLRMVARAAESGPDPELEALAVRALLRSRREAEAVERLGAALDRFCVVPGQALARVADELLHHAGRPLAGWVGVTRTLQLLWQLAPGEDPRLLRIAAAGRQLTVTPARVAATADRELYRWQPPAALREQPFEFRIGGVLLAGSGCRARPDFALDGRARTEARTIGGWARVGWVPGERVRVGVEAEDGRRVTVTAGPRPQPHLRWPFRVDLRGSRLGGSRFRITALLPDGRWEALPDSPLLLEAAVRLPPSERHSARRWAIAARRSPGARTAAPRPARIDVIVPVYGARAETLACLATVLATVGGDADVVVVDDASEDRVLVERLDALSAAGRIELLRNARNEGFVASVNRALARHPTRDAVLLNSDTLVFGDWLQRLRRAAHGADRVGTVTPFANNGSIASYPGEGPGGVTAAEAAGFQALAADVNPRATVEIPVGVGCCLYLRRDCLREVGAFDTAAFGKGYGEEADFCMRARARGWSHRLAADVFVWHAGGRSFAGRRAALLDRSQRLLNLRHPHYDQYVASFIAADPVAPLRRRLDERRLAAHPGPFVLLVTLALAGGVDRFVARRCKDLRGQGRYPLVLRPAAAGRPDRVELWTDALALPNLRYAVPADLPALKRLLAAIRIERVEIQHFLDVDPRVIAIARSLGRSYDVYLHDYVWFCPRITLIDESGRYCGEPDLPACEACIRRNGARLDEPVSVAAVRRRRAGGLRGARAVYAPSADTAARYRRRFAGLSVRVAAPGPALAAAARPPAPDPDGIVRVALIGAIGEHKGYRVLLECARDAARRRLPLQFVVVGYTEDDEALQSTGKVFVTGRYTEQEALHLLRRERAVLAFLPSVWPETWCYALDHAVEAGLPVVAFDLGAIALRLRAAGSGILLPLDCDPSRINDRFLQLAGGEPRAASARPDRRSPRPRASASSDSGALRPMNAARPKHDEAKAGLSASVQVLPLPAGLYLFSVRDATPARTQAAGNIVLPAIYVGLGPGVGPEHVEFVTGPATTGPWLFAPGDMLVARVLAKGATLVLTTIRGAGGETLAINVERLDGRADGDKVAARMPGWPAGRAADPAAGTAAERVSLPLQITAHIRARGDMTFADAPWAGRVEAGLWVESFSVRPLAIFDAGEVEYKGLTASGFETPWLSDDLMCGTRGMAVPLIGFAVRLKPTPKASAYDCEYSGYFQSGTVSGPVRNGAPCRSTVASDSLEGLQVRIVRRATAAVARFGADTASGTAGAAVAAAPPAGPSFGRYRDALPTASSAAGRPAPKRTAGGPPKPGAAKTVPKPEHSGTAKGRERPVAAAAKPGKRSSRKDPRANSGRSGRRKRP